jgi:uncharacterized protein (TIGR03437 family)
MLLAAVAAQAADSGKRVAAAANHPDVEAAAGGQPVNVTSLSSGFPGSVPLPSVTQPTLFAGDFSFSIVVPSGATRLTVTAASTPASDIDLYLRLGADLQLGGNCAGVLCEHASESNAGSETLLINGGSTPPLRAGTYFIAVVQRTTGIAVTLTVTATLETGGTVTPPAVRQLASGTPAPFQFDPRKNPTLFIGAWSYQITVPAGATQLRIQVVTTSPGVDVDLYARFGQDVALSGTDVVADHGSEGVSGDELISVMPSSSPPLRAGTYYIALRLFGPPGAGATGTVTATVTVGSGGGGGGGGGSCPAGSGPNLITNGSFEQAGGTSGALGWNLVTGSVDRWSGWTASDGTWSMDLDGSSFGAIAQTFSTTPGTTYTVLFDLAGNPGGPPAVKRLRVSAASSTSTYEFNITGRTTGAMGWRAETFCFVATGASTTLEFRSLDTESGYYGPAIDNVRVQAAGSGAGGGGSGAPVLSASPRLDFGAVNVNESRDLNLTVRNTGTAGLTISALNSSNPTEFVVLGPATPFDIAAGGQRDAMLRFRPSASGSRSGILTIASNDPTRPSTTIDLSGTGGGSTGPVLTASASTLNFTAPPGVNPPSQTFTLRNTGSTGSVTYLITSSQSWLAARPSSGALQSGQSTTISAEVNVAGLAVGTYDANLRVTLPVGARTPTVEQTFQIVITVRLTIQAGGGGGACPAGPSASPSITAGAVVNAASFVHSALPSGAIGRGAIFSLFGRNLGPTQLVTATRFPLALELGCVSVKVTLGATTLDAIPLAAIETQVNAIMPSNAPLGEATITVTFNGRSSAAQRVRIVESSFGFFTVNQTGGGPAVVQNFESQTSVPLNSPRRPLRRGQRGIAYGSGLGGISTADNQPAPGGEPRVSVELLIGNRRAIVEYAGRTPGFAALDQINFITPEDAPLGCYVPMVARIGGVTTNTVTIAISDDPSRCTDPANPFGTLSGGGKVGSLQMIRLNARLQLDATTNFTNIDVDVGAGLFVESPPAANEFAYNPLVGLPPVGSCSVFSAGGIDLSGLLGGQLPGNAQANARVLNAGPALQISGPRGSKALPRSTDFGGAYFNILGGAIPLLGPPPQPLYLDAGEYTVTGPGGPDVGPFTARFRVPPSFTWSNRDAVAQSTRASGVTFNWTGGDPSNAGVIILGGNLDQPSGAGAAFVCFAEFAPGSFTVPASITGALPPSNLQRPDQTVGFLAIGAGTPANLPTFTATGIDQGYAFFAQFSVLSVVWR